MYICIIEYVYNCKHVMVCVWVFEMVRSSIIFQVPLTIIVPHPEGPPPPLLPQPMTATSYHGNQINLQDHGFSLHVAPVWRACSTATRSALQHVTHTLHNKQLIIGRFLTVELQSNSYSSIWKTVHYQRSWMTQYIHYTEVTKKRPGFILFLLSL